jgi:hypothetical protein
MHTAKRTGQMIYHKSNKLSLPELEKFQFYGDAQDIESMSLSSEGSEEGEGSSDSGPTGMESNDSKNDLGQSETAEKPVLPTGHLTKWSGTILPSSNEGLQRNCIIDIDLLDDNQESSKMELDGYIDIPDQRDVMIRGEGSMHNDGSYDINKIVFDYGNREERVSAEGESSEYGIEWRMLEGEGEPCSWGRIVLSPYRNKSLSEQTHQSDQLEIIDDELVKETISVVYSELQEFEIPYSSSKWKVSYSQMPINQAVELAQYLLESTIKKQIFNSEVPTVGGEILTAVITYDEGMKFID